MSTHHLTTARTAAVALAALVGVTGLVGPASTADAGARAVTRSAGCSTVGTWSMKAVGEAPAMIGVEFSVDTNVPRQRFQVRLFHNGTQLVNHVRATHAPSGSFTVSRRVPNRGGVDHFRATAVRVGSMNTCLGRVRF